MPHHSRTYTIRRTVPRVWHPLHTNLHVAYIETHHFTVYITFHQHTRALPHPRASNFHHIPKTETPTHNKCRSQTPFRGPKCTHHTHHERQITGINTIAATPPPPMPNNRSMALIHEPCANKHVRKYHPPICSQPYLPCICLIATQSHVQHTHRARLLGPSSKELNRGPNYPVNKSPVTRWVP